MRFAPTYWLLFILLQERRSICQIVESEWIIFKRTMFGNGATVQVGLGNHAVYLYSHDSADLYDYQRQVSNVMLFIEAAGDYKILMQFRLPIFEMTVTTTKKADWENNNIECDNYNAYLEIYDGPNILAPLLHRFCGTDFPDPDQIFSSGKYLTLRANLPGPRADGTTSVGDFRIDVSNWNDAGNCTEADMRCDDMSCIPKQLLCDEFNVGHCPDDTDRRADLRSYCTRDPPIDLFGMGWFWRITFIYLIILSLIIAWLCCVRPGIFWYLMGCVRRWDYWPEICHYGCPFYINTCSRPVAPPNPTSIYKIVEYEEVIYEEEDDGEEFDGRGTYEHISSKTTRVTKKGGRKKGNPRRDSGLSFMTGISAVTSSTGKLVPPPPSYTEVLEATETVGSSGNGKGGNRGQGRVIMEIEESTKGKKGGPGKVQQMVKKQVVPSIPPDVCLYEDWNMHVRENRF